MKWTIWLFVADNPFSSIPSATFEIVPTEQMKGILAAAINSFLNNEWGKPDSTRYWTCGEIPYVD